MRSSRSARYIASAIVSLWLAFAPVLAFAAIGAPVQLGVNGTVSGGGATLAITTAADSPAGNLIVVFTGYAGGGVTVVSVTDSAGNTYTPLTAVVNAGVNNSATPFYAKNALHLPSGGTITATFSTSAVPQYVGAVSVANANAVAPLDAQGAGDINGGASGLAPSVSTGPLAQSNEVVFGWVFIASGAADGFTEAPGFISDTATSSAATNILRSAYQLPTNTSSVTYSPVMALAHHYEANVLTFKGLAPPMRPLLGVAQ
jgi:hypothetical protein